MFGITCFASTYDTIADVKRDLMYDPLDFKRTMHLTIQGASTKDAMQKFVFTNEFNQFIGKHKNVFLYVLDENGEISMLREELDI